MKHIIIGTILSIVAISSFAGDKGNGGYVVKCGDSYELADFHEVRVLDGLNNKFQIIYNEDSVEKQVNNKLDILEKNIDSLAGFEPATEVKHIYKRIKNNLKWIEDDFNWSGTDDLGLFPSIQGCEEPTNAFYYLSDKYLESEKRYL